MIVADTSLLVGHLRGNKAAARFLKAQDLVIVPTFVAWELWMGAPTFVQQSGVRDRSAVFDVEPFSAAHAQGSGALQREADAAGRPRPVIDVLIAACAMHHGIPIATLDRDYDGIAAFKVVKVKA